MASKESLGRVRHFDLISQQLRLRHLRSISVRNIVPKFSVSGDCLLDCLLETYFTLHSLEGHQNAIYTSEKIKYSLNPTWASFDPTSWPEQHSTAVTLAFIVRIWAGQNDEYRLIMEWEVHLPSLQYLGDQVKSSKYGHNTVIFGLVDGYYGAPPIQNENEVTSYSLVCATVLKDTNNGKPVVSQRKDAIKVEIDQVQTSYNIYSVQRLQMMQKAIQQAQLSVKDVCQSIQRKVESDLKCTSQLSEEERLTLKIKLLREEFVSKQKTLLKEREVEQGVLEKLREREVNLKRNKEQLDTSKSSLREHKQAHIERRESFVKLNAQLNMRRRQLISELMSIYPIVELQGSKEHLICGVRLPNCESDEFTAMDDETLSVALGYTCHLVSMIAKFLELPLRYPVSTRGSRSTVMDFTIEKVSEKDRKFPLYNRGKEGTKFYYGTFLLNKNIAQIRQFNGLGTPNLRNTLPNLKDLLETKFRSSDPVKSAPLTIIRKSPLKHGKNRLSNSGSGGSRESSPQSNPKLDDVLLKTMNASAGEGKPVLPDQPAKLVSVDQPALPDLSAKSALNQLANPAFQDPLEKPALLNPPAKPDLPDQRAKPALPNSLANPALPNQIANPVSSNPQARSALPDHPAIPALPAKPALPTKPPLPTKPALPEKPVLPAKPVLQGPLSTAQLHQTQTSEKPLMAEGNSSSLGQRNSVALPEVDVVDAKQRTVTVDTALPVPSQGTSRGFLEQKRMKKQHKVQGNTTTSDKPKRTFSLKARRTNTVEKPKLVKCDSVDSTNARIEVSRNCAESTVDELTEFKAHAGFEKWKREKSGSLGPGDTSTPNGKESALQMESKRRAELLARPSVTDKPFRSDEIRSKSPFDVEGSINFDVCENGDLDLR